MKKILLIILCILLVSCSKEINIQNTVTENNNNGKIYWGFVEDTLYISSCESDNAKKSFSIDYAPKTYDDVPWMKFEKEIKKIIIIDCEKKVKPKSMAFWFSLGKLESITGLDNLDTSEVVDMQSLFEACGLEGIDLSTFNTSNVTNMKSMFYGTNFKNIDLSYLDTSNVENMMQMFGACEFEEIDLSAFNTQNVTNMQYMFGWSSNVKNLDLSSFNTEKVINMAGMFSACTGLKTVNVSSFNTINVERMDGMFSSCSSLQSIDLSNFDTKNTRSFDLMFLDCDSLQLLDLSNFDTGNATDMRGMFFSCGSLKDLNITSFNTSNVTDMSHMFGFDTYDTPNEYIKNIDISHFNFDNEETICSDSEIDKYDYLFGQCIYAGLVEY